MGYFLCTSAWGGKHLRAFRPGSKSGVMSPLATGELGQEVLSELASLET